MSFKEVKVLRKAGKLQEAINLAQQELENEPSNIWNMRSISWVYHDYLKKYSSIESFDSFNVILDKLISLKLPPEEKMIFDTCIYQVGKMVFALSKESTINYTKINKLFDFVREVHLTRPSESYTFLYKAFHKLYKTWSNYLDFADWWCFDNFRSQDFLEEEYKGRKIMSLAEQAFIAYSKKLFEGEMIESGNQKKSIDVERIKSFMPKLDALIEKHPEYQYPPYFKAKLMLAVGNNDNIISSFLPFAIQKRNDFWVWDLLAEIYDHDSDIRFACYCKALSLRAPEDFLVKTRMSFAKLLVDRKMYNEGRTEIEKVIAVRSKHNWKLPDQLKDWMRQSWFHKASAKKDNLDLYSDYTRLAEDLLFQNIPEESIVVEFVNEHKKMLNFVKDKQKFGFFNYSSQLIKPIIGDILNVRFNGGGKNSYFKVLTAKRAEGENAHEAIQTFEGPIELIEKKGFGFIKDIFIEPNLVAKNKLTNRQTIKGKAILSYNKKKGTWGWRAITIIP